MPEIEPDTCLTCLGSGEISNERGLSRCPDCDGQGKLRSLFTRNEQRLRQIEQRNTRLSGEAAQDAQWLVGELRRYRVVLFEAMTAAQELGEKEGSEEQRLLHRIQFEANEVLGIYPPVNPEPEGQG